MIDSSFPALAAVQTQAFKALAEGSSITEIAEATGLHRSTVYSWVKTDDDFRMAMLQGRAEYTLALRDELRELAEQAIATLMRIILDPLSPPSVLLRTSMFILNRPEFPKPGWSMPVPVLEPEERELEPDNPLIAEDYQRLRDLDASAASPDGIRQNSTEIDVADGSAESSRLAPQPDQPLPVSTEFDTSDGLFEPSPASTPGPPRLRPKTAA